MNRIDYLLFTRAMRNRKPKQQVAVLDGR